MNDQRREHQGLLLKSLMRMHPKGSAKAQWEVIVGAAARRDRWSGDAGYAVLLPGRSETVPMNQARLVDVVLEANPEPLSNLGYDAGSAVRLADCEYRGGFAIHLDRAALQLEDSGRTSAL